MYLTPAGLIPNPCTDHAGTFAKAPQAQIGGEEVQTISTLSLSIL